jgi:hypothetical protein
MAAILTKNQRSIWVLRFKGFRAVDISKKMGKSRQYVSKSLQSTDSKIYRALAEVARINKVMIKTMNPEKGFLVGFSHELGSQVLITFSPLKGINVWTPHTSQCEGCPDSTSCRSNLVKEAQRLNVDIKDKEKLSPSELAAYIYRTAWPETEPIFEEAGS